MRPSPTEDCKDGEKEAWLWVLVTRLQRLRGPEGAETFDAPRTARVQQVQLQRSRAAGHGNSCAARRSRPVQPRFNGAAPGGARKPTRTTQPRRPRSRFNGAAPGGRGERLFWNLALVAHGASTGPRPGGRGNTSNLRDLLLTSYASTGPRPEGRETIRTKLRSTCSPCFNGAAPGGRGERNGIPIVQSSAISLQRGRARGRGNA